MQKFALLCHPGTPCDAVQRIHVEMELRGSALTACFRMAGDIECLRLPPRQSTERRDELWKHTCCELFVRPVNGRAYYEFNCAPSVAWAAYAFDDYRQGMRNADVTAPRIEVDVGPSEFTLTAMFALPVDESQRVALACVIEETNGRISYWALKHPPGKPDFHHADGFVVEL